MADTASGAPSAAEVAAHLTESKMALRRYKRRRKMPAQVPSLRASRAVRPAARRGRRACGSLPFHPFRVRPAGAHESLIWRDVCQGGNDEFHVFALGSSWLWSAGWVAVRQAVRDARSD